uniref:Sialin n=1 Tax=Aceria tosichella TaxID=561515 RepID=A0A6G1S5W4_9ACAR
MQIKNVRFLMAAITTLSAYSVYVSRVNLSIAIIAMVDDGHQHATGAPTDHNSSQQTNLTQLNTTQSLPSTSTIANNTTTTSLGSSTPPTTATANHFQSSRPLNQTAQQTASRQPPPPARAVGMFPASKQTIMKPPLISQEKFHWDQTEQGHILGAFFYGYILFQIPGARMAELVGARWILMASTAGSALISLVFPIATQLDSIHLLMVLRFVMGLCQSAFFPAAYVFFCRWLPEAERSVLLPIMFIGSNMGSISTYIMSSYLISSSYGWPSVFYVSGLVCLLVTMLWCVFGSNGPQDNWLITDEERDYIMDNMNGSGPNGTPPPQHQDHTKTALPAATGRFAITNGVPSPLNATTYNHLQVSPLPTSASNKGTINKSRSANDLNPNQAACFTSYHPEVIVLETGNMKRQQSNNMNEQNSPNYQQHSIRSRRNTERSLKSVTTSTAGQSDYERLQGRQLSWCKLLGSMPVWTLIFSMYGNEWSQVVLTYELPTYLNKALDIPIEQNGVINSFFQLSYTLASPILSSLGAYMLDRHLMGMRKIHVRKLFQSLATFGQLACFASVPVCGPNRGLIIMFMFSAIVFKACANAGDIMVPGDLSPEFAGTIFALANSIGNTAGFFVPILAGVIVDEQYRRESWTPFWLTTASIMGCSGVIFLIFGVTRRQNYSVDEDEEQYEEGENDDEEEPTGLGGKGNRVKAGQSLDKNNNNTIEEDK